VVLVDVFFVLIVYHLRHFGHPPLAPHSEIWVSLRRPLVLSALLFFLSPENSLTEAAKHRVFEMDELCPHQLVFNLLESLPEPLVDQLDHPFLCTFVKGKRLNYLEANGERLELLIGEHVQVDQMTEILAFQLILLPHRDRVLS